MNSATPTDMPLVAQMIKPKIKPKASTMVELRRRRWTESQLTSRRKGDAGKVQIAWRLRRETTMTLRWIAHRLQMGTWTYVANCLAQKRKNDEKKRKCQ